MTFKIYCECGFGVTGKDEGTAAENMKKHKQGRIHKQLMEFRNLERKNGKGNINKR